MKLALLSKLAVVPMLLVLGVSSCSSRAVSTPALKGWTYPEEVSMEAKCNARMFNRKGVPK